MSTNNELRDLSLEFLARYQADMNSLREDRIQWRKEYLSEPYGNEVAGRSSIVMSDISDTVEWIKPSLMRIFYGGKEVVTVEPIGMEDARGASFLQSKVNHDIQKGNNGFILFHDWFHDALLEKVGIVKYWWEDKEEIIDKFFAGLTSEEVDAFSERYPDLEVLGFDANKDDLDLIDVRARKVVKRSGPKASVIPPEEFIGNIRAKSFAEEDFVCHKKRMHQSEIMREYGIREDALRNSFHDWNGIEDRDSRFSDLGGLEFIQDQGDKSYWYVHECFIFDYDSKGKKNKMVTLLGNTLLKVEDNPANKPPFVSVSPIRLSHRAIGRGFPEMVGDLQKLHSMLARYVLDNVYYQNNAVKVVNPWKISVDDLLNQNHPGGIIKLKDNVPVGDAVTSLPVNPLPPVVFDLFERVQGWKENRVGVTRYNMGTDANTLNKTATGITQILTASQQRMELIARVFAETGVKDLMRAFAEMNITHMEDPVTIRINEEWQEIRKEDIDVFFDVTIDVGIGTGTREMNSQRGMQLLQLLMNPLLLQMGITKPRNVYNIIKVIAENMGYRNVEDFATPPPEAPEGMVPQNEQGLPGEAPGPGPPQSPGGATAGEPDDTGVLQGAGGEVPPGVG